MFMFRKSDIENLKSVDLFCEDVNNPPWFLGPLELSAGLGGGSGSGTVEAPSCLGWLGPAPDLHDSHWACSAKHSLQQQDYPIGQARAVHCKHFSNIRVLFNFQKSV